MGEINRAEPTIATTFDRRRNSLNAIRLILAVLVIVSHTWPVGGYGDDPSLGDQSLGAWAVAGFFAISGYLITSSRLHSRSLADYLWRRVLRIYPAFVVVLLVMAFVFAPIVADVTGDGSWSVGAGAGFLVHNLAIEIRQYGIGSTLSGVPYPNVWNGSLWTLFYEFACYLGVGVAVTVFPRRWLTAVVVVVLMLCAALTLAFESTSLSAPTTIKYLALLAGYFLAGALVYLLRDRIPHRVWIAVLALVLLIALCLLGLSKPFAGLPIAYLMIYGGSQLPLHRIGATNDISYGMYIYAFPVQQVLVYVFPDQRLPALVFAALAVACTTPLAWASWALVERPAMQLKNLNLRRRRPDADLVSEDPALRP
jgi:peptidoglycan/LPS O-acetylase OafA/YrhL